MNAALFAPKTKVPMQINVDIIHSSSKVAPRKHVLAHFSSTYGMSLPNLSFPRVFFKSDNSIQDNLVFRAI